MNSTDKRRMAAVDQFVDGVTYALGLLPIVYSLLIFIDPHKIWHTAGGTYTTAMEVPDSPTSWGIAALLCGLGIIVGQMRRSPTTIAVAAFCASTWFGFFGSAFLLDYLRHGIDTALPGANVYGFLMLIMLLRWRLAVVWR